MNSYKIILDRATFDGFLAGLPDLQPTEVWYACLFGRHKYDKTFPNAKDSGQLARFVARGTSELAEKIQRLEGPLGSYSRDGAVASQDCLALYMAPNPRSLVKANRNLLVELARRIADGDLSFNPISVATTEVHRAVDRKLYVDFDFDLSNQPPSPGEAEELGQACADLSPYLPRIATILPDPAMYRILRTRGGFHLLVDLAKIKDHKPDDGFLTWHQRLSALPNCDVKGTGTLAPVPGCTQGGFIPYFYPYRAPLCLTH